MSPAKYESHHHSTTITMELINRGAHEGAATIRPLTRPQFSMAPIANSGMATISCVSHGVGGGGRRRRRRSDQ